MNEIYINHILYIMYILYTKKCVYDQKKINIYDIIYYIHVKSYLFNINIYIYIHYIHLCFKNMCIIRYRTYVMSILYLFMSHTLFTYNI